MQLSSDFVCVGAEGSPLFRLVGWLRGLHGCFALAHTLGLSGRRRREMSMSTHTAAVCHVVFMYMAACWAEELAICDSVHKLDLCVHM